MVHPCGLQHRSIMHELPLTTGHTVYHIQGRLNSAMSSLAADHDREVCTAAVAVSDLYKKVWSAYLERTAVFRASMSFLSALSGADNRS